MVRLLEADPGALLGASLEFAVVQAPDGQVTVTWADHAAAVARYDDPASGDPGRELAAPCEAVAAQALA